MATLTITPGEPQEIAVSVNQTQVNVTQQNNINVEVTPTPRTEITLDRGRVGPPGPAGPSEIGGYGFNISGLQPFDVLMFGGSAWENTPQTEITDGGNF